MCSEYGARAFVYGWAAPNESVIVTLAHSTYNVTASAGGPASARPTWRVTLNPHGTATGLTMTVTGSQTPFTYTFNDVAYGDVYLCSGQR